MKLLLAGGGSLGHLSPLLAVRSALPDWSAHLLCSQRPEEHAFAATNNLPYTAIPRPRGLLLPLQLLHGMRRANHVITTTQPDVVFSTGGSIAVPVCLAARQRGIPIVLHNADAVMGRANRFLASRADTLCLGYPLVQPVYHPHAEHTGNPVRPSVLQGSREEGLRITGLSGARPVLLICGGSQGAQAINDAVTAQLDALLAHADIIHLTGPGKAGALPRNGYVPLAFAGEELPHLYAVATAAVSRAGANTIAELHAWHRPMILIPLRGLAQDHQWFNAQAAATDARCTVLEQSAIARLPSLLPALLAQNGAHQPVRESTATTRIAEILQETVAHRVGNQ